MKKLPPRYYARLVEAQPVPATLSVIRRTRVYSRSAKRKIERGTADDFSPWLFFSCERFVHE